jgi:hypothetical protein
MSWHAGPDLLAAYRTGQIDPAQAASVEAHLIGCAQCRAAVAAGFDISRLERMWSTVEETVDTPRSRWLVQLLERLRLPRHIARLVAAVPAARQAWAFGVASSTLVAVGFAVMVDRGDAALLLVAPLLPLAGVALTFGPFADPAYEIGLATPTPALRLLLLRTAAVVIGSLVIVGGAAAVVPGVGWEAAAWLLPALGLTCASLALATWLPLLAGLSVAAAGWVVAVITTADVTVTAAGRIVTSELVSAVAQAGWAALAVLGLAVLLVRRDAFESVTSRRTVL